MPERFPSYRTEPDAEFADRLEWLLAQRLGAPTSSSASEIIRATSVIGTDTPITRRHDQDGPGARRRPGRRLLNALRSRVHGRPPTSTAARAGSDDGETVVEQPIFSEQKGDTP